MAAQPPPLHREHEQSRSAALHPQGDQDSREQPAREQPAREQPAREQPAREQPAREQPAREEPADRRAPDGRQETAMERLDRNLEELTGELRVVVTGVQVLFAFLLVVPFDTGFTHVGDFERAVYFITLLLAALAAAFTIAPSAQHRLLFRHYDKQRLVFVSNREVIAGLWCLALAMCGSVLLVTSTLFGVLAGVLTAIGVAVPFAWMWFGMPLRRKRALGTRGRSAEH